MRDHSILFSVSPMQRIQWLSLLGTLAAAIPAAAAPSRAGGVDFDGDPMADLRRRLPARVAAAADRSQEQDALPRIEKSAAPDEAPAAPPPPAPEPAPAPRRSQERVFRQITGFPTEPFPGPWDTSCDPSRNIFFGCDVVDPLAPRGRGGYYYGLIPGPDGRLRYGKLYLPHYGDFDGQAHNNPPLLRSSRALPRVRRDPPPD